MIKWSIQEGGFIFYHTSSKNKPFYQWEVRDDPSELLRYGLLKEKIENGLAELQDDKVFLTAESLYDIEEGEEKEIEALHFLGLLGFPPPYPHKIFIKNKGVLGQRDFQYEVIFCKNADPHTHTEPLSYERQLNLLKNKNSDEPCFTLTFGQYQVLEHIEIFNKANFLVKTPEHDLEQFAVIRKLSEKNGIIISKTLLNETIIQPERIGIQILPSDKGKVSIKPQILDSDVSTEIKEGFRKDFDGLLEPKKIYKVSNGSKRIRIVLKPKQANAIRKMKEQLQDITREKLVRLIKSPTEFFDPTEDDIDLSELYSDRVITLGVYQPKVYPFIKEYKSEWLPGIRVDDDINGRGIIEFKSLEEVNNFKIAILEAIEKNEKTVDWNGILIPINEAEALLPLIEKQIRNPKQPQDEGKEEKVLIIKENAEELEYALDHTICTDYGDFEPIDTLPSPVPLKEHQKQGIGWLQQLYKNQKSGCLLADEMGLGKTLQILYFLEWVYSIKKPVQFLIVAPLGLLENWEEEHQKFFPHTNLKQRVLHRDKDTLKELLENKKPTDSIIFLTNYETLRDYQLLICAIPFTVVVLDEAQKIKTPGRLITNAAKALKCDFRIACTGTPVENSFYDLWCIMDFCNPGLLGHARQFGREYGITPKASPEEVQKIGQELRARIGRFMLRRQKKEILRDLPPKYYSDDQSPDSKKHFHDLELELFMPKQQKDEYEKVKDQGTKLKAKVLDKQVKEEILCILHKLKCISDHPFLYKEELRFSHGNQIAKDSARMIGLIKLLERIKALQEKAIIFAEFRKTQILIWQLLKTLFNIEASIINGDTPVQKNSNHARLTRQEAVARFNNAVGFHAIIMSPIAAGVGLNVTGANHVIHFSRHWNPAKEEQATDRAHRIGQTKTVFVYYPKALIEEYDSFDVVLSKLIQSKRQIASAMLYPTEMVEVKAEEILERVF